MKHYDGLDKKEYYEATKFDRVTKEQYSSDEKLIIDPIHWEKFERETFVHQPYAYLVKLLGDLKNKRILEIGCGSGIFSVILAKRGAKLVEAFDISEDSIKVAKKRAIVNNVSEQISHRASSIYDVQYDAGSIDAIVGLNILHHVEIDRIAGKLASYLKPGGRAYFMEPFGNARWLEKLRLYVPVKVNEVDKSHWDEKLKYSDIEKFKPHFAEVYYREFHLFSRLDRVIKSQNIRRYIGKLDESLFSAAPFLKKYARRIVIELRK